MLERKIPNLHKSTLLFPLLGKQERTEANYVRAIETFEIKCEESAHNTLLKLGINCSVKTDRYSLPYTEEVISELPGESYMNGAYEFYRAIRPFVKELLNKDYSKIRFYIYIELQDRKEFHIMGSVKYHFRYFPHY